MKARFGPFFAVALFLSPCVFAQLSGVAESHIDGNVPDTKDFKPFLIHDLTAYLKSKLEAEITVGYELLRDVPTQSGVASPKFYLWVTATKPDKTVIEGAVRVAAIDKKEFEVTDFITRGEITAQPDAIAKVFPQALLDKIRKKAGVNQ